MRVTYEHLFLWSIKHPYYHSTLLCTEELVYNKIYLLAFGLWVSCVPAGHGSRHQQARRPLHTSLLDQKPLGLCPCHGDSQDCDWRASGLKLVRVSVQVVFVNIPLVKASQAQNKQWSALSPPWSHDMAGTFISLTRREQRIKNSNATHHTLLMFQVVFPMNLWITPVLLASSELSGITCLGLSPETYSHLSWHFL